MKKIVLIAAALGVLVAAGAAYAAAVNSYQATLSFSSKKAGTPAKPAPVGYVQKIKATGPQRQPHGGPDRHPDQDLRPEGRREGLPDVQRLQDRGAGDDTTCPKGALVATGSITASVGAAKDFTAAGTACDPLLHVWNSGQGKLTFFFVDRPRTTCA